MPGVTKRIFLHEMREILNDWNSQLKCIRNTLPKEYSHQDVVDALKIYYPHEWKSVEIKYSYYKIKDKHILRKFGKSRYNMPQVEQLLRRAKEYQSIMSTEYKIRYSSHFTDEFIESERQILWKKRESSIQRVSKKIKFAQAKVQHVTPVYIDKLIGLYERKNTSQKDRVYILAELKKYYSDKIIRFFYKINDTELNEQLRNEAFRHLQSFNYCPRLRGQKHMKIHTKNKKRREYLEKVYSKERFSPAQTPKELEYRINNSKEQQLKKYDFFISHSYKDSVLVQKLIEYENNNGNDVFCDWINDSDYLKRHLLCDETLRVIEKRLEQSKALLFLRSKNSTSSVWCIYELNYFKSLDKPIYTILADDVENSIFKPQLELGDWFIYKNYKSIIKITDYTNKQEV